MIPIEQRGRSTYNKLVLGWSLFTVTNFENIIDRCILPIGKIFGIVCGCVYVRVCKQERIMNLNELLKEKTL